MDQKRRWRSELFSHRSAVPGFGNQAVAVTHWRGETAGETPHSSHISKGAPGKESPDGEQRSGGVTKTRIRSFQ